MGVRVRVRLRVRAMVRVRVRELGRHEIPDDVRVTGRAAHCA